MVNITLTNKDAERVGQFLEMALDNNGWLSSKLDDACTMGQIMALFMLKAKLEHAAETVKL